MVRSYSNWSLYLVLGTTCRSRSRMSIRMSEHMSVHMSMHLSTRRYDVTIKKPSGKTAAVSVRSDQSVGTLRNKIFKVSAVKPAAQVL